MYLQKEIIRKTSEFFVGILKVNDENSSIRIQDPDPLVRGSGSVPKCHGYATLIKAYQLLITWPRFRAGPYQKVDSGYGTMLWPSFATTTLVICGTFRACCDSCLLRPPSSSLSSPLLSSSSADPSELAHSFVSCGTSPGKRRHFYSHVLAQMRITGEPVFLNVYGARESIPRNEFRRPMQPGGPIRKPYSYSVHSPHRLFKNSGSGMRIWGSQGTYPHPSKIRALE